MLIIIAANLFIARYARRRHKVRPYNNNQYNQYDQNNKYCNYY